MTFKKNLLIFAVILLFVPLVLPAFAQQYGDTINGFANTYSFDIENYNYLYKEPAFMQESGSKLGLMFTDILRNHNDKYSIKLQLRYAYGALDYASASGRFSGIPDNENEGRILFGLDKYLSSDSIVTIYCGLGERLLINHLTEVGPGGYGRVSNYFYLPVELEYSLKLAENSSFGFVIGYDYLLQGDQRSYSSDVDPGLDDNDNAQRLGSGYRWSIKYSNEFGGRDIGLNIFARYWNINRSVTDDLVYHGAVVGQVWEPTNLTIEQGLSLYINF